MRNESHKQALNTDGKLTRTFEQELHVGLGGRSKDRQGKNTANRLVMSCNHVQAVASMQACICNQQINHEAAQRVQIAAVYQMSIVLKGRHPGFSSSCQVAGLGTREHAFVSRLTVIGGSVYDDRVMPGYYEIHCHNRDLAMAPACSRCDRRQKRCRGTSYEDPSI